MKTIKARAKNFLRNQWPIIALVALVLYVTVMTRLIWASHKASDARVNGYSQVTTFDVFWSGTP